MKIRAVIFDLYGTLLEVGPRPPDAATRWNRVWRETLGAAPRLNFGEFEAACREVVAAEHAAARGRGILFPEVYWPAVVDAVLPEFARLPAAVRNASPVFSAGLMHSVRLAPGAGEALRAADEAALHLGLASNCQPYSLRELDAALEIAGLKRDRFQPDLSFFSFEYGFSKPDPHVFQLLTARLRARGIAPAETIMVGDSIDNDLVPARACGWQTFAIQAGSATGWARLRELFLHL